MYLLKSGRQLRFQVWILADPCWKAPIWNSIIWSEFDRTNQHPLRRKGRELWPGGVPLSSEVGILSYEWCHTWVQYVPFVHWEGCIAILYSHKTANWDVAQHCLLWLFNGAKTYQMAKKLLNLMRSCHSKLIKWSAMLNCKLWVVQIPGSFLVLIQIVLSELFPRRTYDFSETSLGNSVQRLKICIRWLESEEDNGGMSQWDAEKWRWVFTV